VWTASWVLSSISQKSLTSDFFFLILKLNDPISKFAYQIECKMYKSIVYLLLPSSVQTPSQLGWISFIITILTIPYSPVFYSSGRILAALSVKEVPAVKTRTHQKSDGCYG
jgi:hypothetical protein